LSAGQATVVYARLGLSPPRQQRSSTEVEHAGEIYADPPSPRLRRYKGRNIFDRRLCVNTDCSDGKVIITGDRIPDGAESELIVASDHGAQYHQQAIREVERIVKEHLTGKN
jgi:hypothetical protein